MVAGRFAIRPIVRYSHLVGAPNGEVRAPTESQKQKSSRLTGHREERDMAFDRSFVMHAGKKPGGSFGETMNDIRSWLDHRKIQPALFKPVASDRSGVGFEIGFNSEDEARLFEREFT